MAGRGCAGAALLGALSMAALLVAVVAALNAVGCCAIDCDRFPEKCAENRRRQETASVVLLVALVVSAGAMGGAVHAARKR